MSRFAIITLFALVIAAPVATVRSQKGREFSPAYVEGRVLVKLRGEAERPQDEFELARSVLPEAGVRARVLDPNSPDSRGALYLIELASDVTVEQAIELAAADPRIEYIEPDYLIYPTVIPNDARFNEMWGLYNDGSLLGKAGVDIGATKAWDLTIGSEETVVAMSDTGVDLSHGDLADNSWVNVREVPGNNVDDDNNGFVDDLVGWNFLDDNGQVFVNAQSDFHGTHVAGTIGAVGNNSQGTTGVAWRVKLMSLKFLGAGPGTTSNAIKTIRYAIEQKRRGVNVRAINASWGGSGNSQSLHDAIREAGDAGITFVCSAGNGGSDYRGDNTDEFPDYPGSWSSEISSLISVAAIDRSDELAGFSNYGHMTITVAAPGVQILSTYPGSLYIPTSGTSMSTPHVTGIVALLTTYDPTLTPAQVKARIIRTAEPVLSLASKVVSSGRANAFNALTDRVPPPGSVEISAVRTDKKFVYVDGLNFVSGSTVGEANGVRLKKTRYDDSYAVGNGTLTRLRIKLGKSGVRDTFPLGVPVTVTVFDPNTGERSPGFTYTRY